MALREILLPWDTQPQEAVGIDWANPLARNLEFAVVPSLGLRNLVDGFSGFAVSGALDQVVPGVVGMTPAQTASGTMVQPTLTSAGHPNAAKSDVSVLSALVIGYQSTTKNNDLRLGRANGSAAPSWSVGYHSGSNNGPHAIVGTFTRAGFSSGWTRIDKPTAVLLTADGSTARVYVGGVQVDSGSYTEPTYEYSSFHGRGVFFGGDVNSAATGPSFLGLLWANRVLTADEVREVSVNPWQLFAPRQIWVPQSAGGPSMPTLSLPTVTAIGATQATPRVTLTY